MDNNISRENLTNSPSQNLQADVVSALKTVYDPEIPINIYDLGLIYGLDVGDKSGEVYVQMTLTTPNCPVAQSFPQLVENTLLQVSGVERVTVELVWDPPWSTDRMSELARKQLDFL